MASSTGGFLQVGSVQYESKEADRYRLRKKEREREKGSKGAILNPTEISAGTFPANPVRASDPNFFGEKTGSSENRKGGNFHLHFSHRWRERKKTKGTGSPRIEIGQRTDPSKLLRLQKKIYKLVNFLFDDGSFSHDLNCSRRSNGG